jgi:hypothetical protein
MVKLNPQYVVDRGGQQRGVLLTLEEYRALLEAVEDQLDAVDLDEAIKKDSQFTPYEQVRAELGAEGLLRATRFSWGRELAAN